MATQDEDYDDGEEEEDNIRPDDFNIFQKDNDPTAERIQEYTFKWLELMIEQGRHEILYDLNIKNKLEIIPFARRVVHTKIGEVVGKLKSLSKMFHEYIIKSEFYKGHGVFDEVDYRVLQAKIIEQFLAILQIMLPALGAADATLEQISDDFTSIEIELKKQAVPTMIRETTVVLTIISKEGIVDEKMIAKMSRDYGIQDIQKHILQGLKFGWIERDGNRVKWKNEKLKTFIQVVGEIFAKEMLPEILIKKEDQIEKLQAQVRMLQDKVDELMGPKGKKLQGFDIGPRPALPPPSTEAAQPVAGTEELIASMTEMTKAQTRMTEALEKQQEQQQTMMSSGMIPSYIPIQTRPFFPDEEPPDLEHQQVLQPDPYSNPPSTTELEAELMDGPDQPTDFPGGFANVDEKDARPFSVVPDEEKVETPITKKKRKKKKKEPEIEGCPKCDGAGNFDGDVCPTCEGKGVVVKKKKRRTLSKEEIEAEERKKAEVLAKFNSIPPTQDQFQPCYMVGKDDEGNPLDPANCMGPDPKYFLNNPDVIIPDEWDTAPRGSWFRPTTIMKKGKKCYYQIEIDPSSDEPEGDDPDNSSSFNCAKHVLVKNRIDEFYLLGDPEAVFPCPFCRESFKKQSNLDVHVEKVHTSKMPNPDDEAMITCPKCFYDFQGKDEWDTLEGECPHGCGKVEIE